MMDIEGTGKCLPWVRLHPDWNPQENNETHTLTFKPDEPQLRNEKKLKYRKLFLRRAHLKLKWSSNDNNEDIHGDHSEETS